MRIMYLAICVQDGGDVKSVTPFDTYEQANDFIAKSAADMYDKIHEKLTSGIEVWFGGAEIVDGEEVYSWSIYSMVLEKEDGVMLVKRFAYDGFFVKEIGGYENYTATFKEWTKDPGVAVCMCSDGKERRIPTCCLDVFDYDAHPRQNNEGKLFYIGEPSNSK